MTIRATDQRFAVLLSSLGDEFCENVLGLVTPDMADSIKRSIGQLEKVPPSESEMTEVLEEFHRFMEFALGNSEEILTTVSSDSDEQDEQFVTTGNPYDDLNVLHDYQIAGALRNETAATAALVLSQMPDERAASVLGQLPESIRQPAFMRLQDAPRVPAILLRKIIQGIVDNASRLDQSATSDPDYLADQKTARLLRAMDRKTRTEMMAALTDKTPDVAERVKELLFIFEDIKKFTDKSVQKLMAEVQTSDLVIALKNCEEEIRDKVLSNLSKRAKASLVEEMEFLDSVSEEEETAAVKNICAAFAVLDEAGNLEMVE